MPTKHDGCKDCVLDQLPDLREVSCHAMFGGYGLSCRRTFFGIGHNGRLDFDIAPATVAPCHSQSMTPFRATSNMTLKTYYRSAARYARG